MRTAFLILMGLVLSSMAFAENSCRETARLDYKAALEVCDSGGGSGDSNNTCAVNCLRRYSDGSCANYGADFCGRNAQCATNCARRYSNGSCATYAPDFCGPNAECVEKCIRRYSDGSCATFDSDSCYASSRQMSTEQLKILAFTE